MPSNFLVTGMPKTGKTTLLRELVDDLKGRGLRVGGFISPEESHHGTRTAFHVKDIDSGKTAVLASVDGDGPKVSKYHVDVRSFESVAIPCMECYEKYDVFVIDEIGRMEMMSERFGDLLQELMESDTPFIVSVHRDYVDQYKPFGELFRLTGSNREAVRNEIAKKAGKGIKKKPKKKAAKKAAKKKPSKKRAPKKAAKKKKAVKKKAKPKTKRPQPKRKPVEKERPQRPEPGEEEGGFFGKVKDLIGI